MRGTSQFFAFAREGEIEIETETLPWIHFLPVRAGERSQPMEGMTEKGF